MIDYLKLFASWINSPKTMFVFGGVAALALFLPGCWIEAIHLSSPIDDHRHFLWLVFGICSLGLAFDGGKGIYNRQSIKNRLHHLARDEQQVLSDFVLNWDSSRPFPAGYGPVGSLVEAGILFLTPTAEAAAQGEGYIHFTIKPWVLKYLDKNRRLLGDYQIRRSSH